MRFCNLKKLSIRKNKMLKGKNILIGITGGIAAYKICELVRMYKRANANVKVVCTQNALNFITPLTLQSLTQNEVAYEEFNIQKDRKSVV